MHSTWRYNDRAQCGSHRHAFAHALIYSDNYNRIFDGPCGISNREGDVRGGVRRVLYGYAHRSQFIAALVR
jgi:hypothetical protein